MKIKSVSVVEPVNTPENHNADESFSVSVYSLDDVRLEYPVITESEGK